jgi:type IV secretory pathway VirB10-like protein
LKARAAFVAALTVLVVPATADASSAIDVNCERVTIDYTQWESGPPDASHTSVRVDGAFVFDEVVSFPGSTYRLEVPLNLNDGREHTIEAKHDWISHELGTKEVRATLTCGSPPPTAEQPPPQQPPTPPAPPAPPVPTTPAVAPTPPSSGAAPDSGTKAERQKARRQKAKRRRQRAEARRERQRAQKRATSHRLPRTTG